MENTCECGRFILQKHNNVHELIEKDALCLHVLEGVGGMKGKESHYITAVHRSANRLKSYKAAGCFSECGDHNNKYKNGTYLPYHKDVQIYGGR